MFTALLLLSGLGAQELTADLTWRLDLEHSPSPPLTESRFEELLAYAAGTAPPEALAVEIRARGPHGRLRSLESFLPPASAPVPPKEPTSPRRVPPRTHPADHPGATEGALSGKAVYLSQCHGWIWYDSLDGFSTQRGNYYDTVEDFHNPEAMNQYLAPWLENAGAAVFTAKDRDMNSESAVADNDGAGYAESGSGFEDGGAGFADAGPWAYGEDPFDTGTTRRFPAAGGGTATWTPTVPADGHYHLYVSWDADSEHAPDAHYRITHPGGVLDRTFDQTVHGSTWQYVEQLWLPQGTGALTVELVADSDYGDRYLSADAVRIGGGMGDVERYGEITERPRWESGAYLYAQYNGAPTSVYDPYEDGVGSDPSSRSRWADWEHPAGEDALYLSWHSNAGGGTGTSTYYYEGSSGDPVEGSDELATLLQNEIVDAARTLWDSDWTDRGVKRAAFSEVNPYHNDEMPAALVELAFHDHEEDVEYLKDPDFRRDAARAMYRAVVQYFADRDGTTPRYLPEPPDHVRLTHDGSGNLELSWEDGPAGAPYGDAAESWWVETSGDGRSWDAGTAVSQNPVDLEKILDTSTSEAVYVRVAGVNEGGISFPSEVVGARRSADGYAPVLVVSAFDRLETSNLVWEDVGGSIGEVVRMYLWRINRFDTAAVHGRAIDAAGWPFDTVSDEAFSEVDLSAYRLVVWVAGEESTHDSTFTTEDQEILRAFVEDGGALWASGAEILWDLDEKGSSEDLAFAEEVLGARLDADDAGTTQVDGEDLLAGLYLDFAEADGAPYPVEYPDVLDSERTVIARYQGGEVAAVMGEGVALFGFPFECIGDAETREEVASRLLSALVPDYEPPEDEGDTGHTGDTGETDAPPPPDWSRVPMDETGGCGCGTRAAPAVGPWALLLLVVGRVRSRRSSSARSSRGQPDPRAAGARGPATGQFRPGPR